MTENDELLREMTDACNMAQEDLCNLFDCMIEEQYQRDVMYPEVDYATFVKHLQDQHSLADRRTVLHVMMHMRKLEQKFDSGMTSLVRMIRDAVPSTNHTR